MEDIVRVGIISTVNPAMGTAQVYYPDRDSTTEQMHLFAFRSEFCLPDRGDQVVVLHLSNDTSSGVILGRFWGEADPPPAGVKYRMDFDVATYEALANDVFTIHASEISLQGDAGNMSLSELIDLKRRVEELERRAG